MKFISLFAGIGGMELGLERAGLRCVAQVEIDDYATRVLQKHWPDVPKFRDVRDVGAHNLPSADLICGGFPCQDISNAGKRAGITGERSGLWSEFARVIRELRPRYVLVENVAALLHRGLDVVLGDLAACGYDAEWQCIPAAAVGAPHRRDRLFVVAYAEEHRRGTGRARRPIASRAWQSEQTLQAMADAQPNPRIGWTRKHRPVWRRKPTDCGWWAVESPVGRVAYGIPDWVDRIGGLGNAVAPQVAEYVGRLILEHAQEASS